jgi:N-acetyl-gamma-glutamyl-phosphate reductase
MPRTLRVAIVGAAGYSGAELASLLLLHPQVEIVGVFGSAKRDASQPQVFGEVFPRFRGRLDLPLLPGGASEILACRPDVVFLATPHEASVELAPGLLEGGAVVLDLSAAFRLRDAGLYPAFYGFEHARPELLASAVYGLPEMHREQIRGANLIAVPGCYPTSAILPLAPLVRAGAIAADGAAGTGRLRRPIVDSTSGVSGAGRKAEQRLLFCEVSQSAYGIFKHRHQPEIDAYAGTATLFTPHLGPYERGILSTIHVDLAPGWTAARVRGAIEAAYAGERFVRLLPKGTFPSVADVRGTNFCDIGVAVDEAWSHAIIVSAIDNLTKGAAGQAVQCMNIRMGFDEATALSGPVGERNEVAR